MGEAKENKGERGSLEEGQSEERNMDWEGRAGNRVEPGGTFRLSGKLSISGRIHTAV